MRATSLHQRSANAAHSPRRPFGSPHLSAALAVIGLFAVVGPVEGQTLDLHFIDVEGGQSTLLVTPSGASLLVDTGWPTPNERDTDRIVAALRAAGVDTIDYLVITHFHDDHVGGMEALVRRVPVRTVVTHGPNTETGRMATIVDPIFRNAMALSGAREIVARPGDVIPFPDVEIRVLSSNRDLIPEPLPGAGSPNPHCEGVEQRREDRSDNSASVGMLITFGAFRFLDLGDVTQDLEYVLMCPVNRIGEVDLFLTSHHGAGASNGPYFVHALGARVAIMNNGARKGGDPVVIQTVRTAPGLEDFWMLHYSEAAGPDVNVAEPFIANLTDAPTETGNDTGFGFRVTASRDGSFTVTNQRTGFSKTYAPRP